jgi:hypothetical protein
MKFVNRCSLVVIIHLFLTSCVIAQSKSLHFEVPPKYASLLFVDDPACPLKLSGPPKVISNPNGAFSFGYALTNTSDANVESFLVKEIDWYGISIYEHPSTVTVGRTFSPGVTDYTLPEQEMANLAKFDKVAASKNGIISRPNRFWVVMVTNVRLSDGTVYDASRKYELLNDFINQPFSKSGMSLAELTEREKQLRAFVANLLTSKSGSSSKDQSK